VGREITAGRLEGVIEQTSPRVGAPQRITATPDSEGEAEFRLDLRGLEEGYHTVRAEVHLTPPDDGWPRILAAGERTVQAVNRAVTPQPPAIDFGDIYPGDEDTVLFGLGGNFAETEVRVALEHPDRVPACVTVRFADRPLGEGVKILPGQNYPLQLAAAEECGPEEVFPVETHLKIAMDELPEVGTVTVPVSWRLDNTSRRVDALRFELVAGSAGEGSVEAPPTGGQAAGAPSALRYDATLDPLHADGEAAKHLRLGFLDERGEVRMLRGEDGEPVRRQQVELTAGQPLGLRVEAMPCCPTDDYSGELRLRPVDGGAPVVVPIEAKVTESWWTCYRSRVIAGLLGLLAFLLTVYVFNMFAHTHLLPRRDLAARLIPLHWPRYGGAPRPGSDRGGDREVVEDIVGAGMGWRRRALAWLKANPLVFGLPWQRYRETAELHLAGDFDLCSVSLAEERDIVARLQGTPELDPGDEGRLFARAGSGVDFYAVRGPKSTVGVGLSPAGWHGRAAGYGVELLSKGQRLVHRIAEADRKEERVGGWELG
jgi:hypothetical protein